MLKMWERKFPKIKDVIPMPNGVFHFMNYTFRAEVSKEQLDFLLMASYAQRNPAPVIDLIYDEDEEHTGDRKLNDLELTKLAALMLAYYKPRWDKLGDVYDVEYDPIHNYLDQWEDESDGTHEDERVLDSDRVDTLNTSVQTTGMRTDNLTQNNTGTQTHALSGTDSEEHTGTVENEKTGTVADAHTGTIGDSGTETGTDSTTHTGTVTDSGTNSSTDSKWGFNSGTAVNTDSTSGTTGNTRTDNLTDAETKNLASSNTRTFNDTDTTTHNTTDTRTDNFSIDTDYGKTDTRTDNLTQTNTGTQSTSGSEATTGSNSRATDETETTDGSDHRERSGRHFGNIGNLTSQKMLKEEIELWKWNYVQSILDDARQFLTLDVYL